MAGYGSIELWMVRVLNGFARRTAERLERPDDRVNIL